jgi:hypothetical protein
MIAQTENIHLYRVAYTALCISDALCQMVHVHESGEPHAYFAKLYDTYGDFALRNAALIMSTGVERAWSLSGGSLNDLFKTKFADEFVTTIIAKAIRQHKAHVLSEDQWNALTDDL